MEVLQDNAQVVNKEILYLDSPLIKISISGIEEKKRAFKQKVLSIFKKDKK